MILLTLVSQFVLAAPILDDASRGNAARLLHGADESGPYGRLMIALTAIENDANESTIYALASTHPQIAEMMINDDHRVALEYILTMPSGERHKLRKGSSVIRSPDQMNKIEKKYATILAKHLGLPKKINAIRIGSFDGVTIDVEVSYKKSGQVEKETIQFAGPNTPIADKNSRLRIFNSMGVMPAAPLDGQYSILPLSSNSFENGLGAWNRAEGFKFEATQPYGVISLDKDDSMDGETSLRFYNTEKTRVFESLSQTVPIREATEVRLQCFIQTKNAQVEYRQDPAFTFIALKYWSPQNELLREEHIEIRLGTYSWEAIVHDSYVPQAAEKLEVVLLSSVSGTIWIDGLSIIQN